MPCLGWNLNIDMLFRAAATLIDKLPYNQMVSPDLIERVSIINTRVGGIETRGT